ncbi:DUF2933 domain-containing protein [Aquibacillus salsiterrae]|uniref:DUF2933 domain-containing protein n=1 Tax=Aquibacillus salsiterrae TaxID=2950439 RepID=A0A9X3WE04_9BACI|nr:DUF2933 domain-containing protein [Aquibacillus salsiterrae]MDC3418130.1 DUF2933 domain-containing protein [Aquibacillus salsiterrae]
MSWTLLLLLACPLMMLFCMKGMFTGNKDKDSKSSNVVKGPQQDELQSVQLKMAELMEQNHKLMEEVNALKSSDAKGQAKDENVIKIDDSKQRKEA